MTIHQCKHCNYSTIRTTLLNKHLLTQKHKNNMLIKRNVDISNNTVINKIFEVTTSQNTKMVGYLSLLESVRYNLTGFKIQSDFEPSACLVDEPSKFHDGISSR